MTTSNQLALALVQSDMIAKHVGKVSKGANIRNRYKQVPHLTHETNGKVTNSQLDTINESKGGRSFPAGDHKAHINRRAQRHSKHKPEKYTNDSQKKTLNTAT